MNATLSSMTGFGRAESVFKDVRWTWELKSVNGRSLDLRFRLPQGMDAFESEVREVLSKAFSRGTLNASLMLDRPQRAFDIRINEGLLKQIVKLAAQINLPPPHIDGLLAVRGVLDIVEAPDDEAFQQDLSKALLNGLHEAVSALQKARIAEGAIISALFVAQMETIKELIKEAEKHPSRRAEAIKARLQEQIATLRGDNSFDEDRLYQEALLLATRIDIREELDRLNAHVSQLRKLLSEGGAIGRRLDFLAQEFNREANTLCSKANDKDLTAIGLSLKNVIDQLREQAQNIE